MISLSKAVLKEELELASKVILKWQQLLEEGIPGKDIPAQDDMVEYWAQEFCAELFLVARKLESIADITANADMG